MPNQGQNPAVGLSGWPARPAIPTMTYSAERTGPQALPAATRRAPSPGPGRRLVRIGFVMETVL